MVAPEPFNNSQGGRTDLWQGDRPVAQKLPNEIRSAQLGSLHATDVCRIWRAKSRDPLISQVQNTHRLAARHRADDHPNTSHGMQKSKQANMLHGQNGHNAVAIKMLHTRHPKVTHSHLPCSCNGLSPHPKACLKGCLTRTRMAFGASKPQRVDALLGPLGSQQILHPMRRLTHRVRLLRAAPRVSRGNETRFGSKWRSSWQHEATTK